LNVTLQKVPRRLDWPWWSVAIVLGWLGLVAASVALSQAKGFEISLCMFKKLTGLPCPTCGATRGCLSILHGHIIDGWLFNPMLFTIFGLWVASVALRLGFGRAVKFNLSRRQRIISWIAITVMVLVNWAYLIAYVH